MWLNLFQTKNRQSITFHPKSRNHSVATFGSYRFFTKFLTLVNIANMNFNFRFANILKTIRNRVGIMRKRSRIDDYSVEVIFLQTVDQFAFDVGLIIENIISIEIILQLRKIIFHRNRAVDFGFTRSE